MKERLGEEVGVTVEREDSRERFGHRPVIGLVLFTAVLLVVYWRPLAELLRLSLDDNLYSHVVLVPFITGYLIWIRRGEFRNILFAGIRGTRNGIGPVCLALGGVAMLLARWTWDAETGEMNPYNRVFFHVGSLVVFFWAGVWYFLGGAVFRAFLFPWLFLVFVVPMPEVVVVGVEHFFQKLSAVAAEWCFQASGTPVMRIDQLLVLPGLNMEVAQECSGIRSSYVLLITGLLAGHLFMRRYWKRTVLALAFIPIGIARNAFRIWTIGFLTINVDPEIIHGPLHRRGGPVFFVLSLVPLFALLWWLRRSEKLPARTED